MSAAEWHQYLVWLEYGLAAVTFAALLFVVAPYGRHGRSGWGPTIPNRFGWVLMESPAVLVFLAIYLVGDHRAEATPLVLLGIWQVHYINRTFIYPLRMRPGGKPMPVLIAASAISFNLLNAYVNARFISHVGTYTEAWLHDPRFVAGAALFALGLAINWRADATLRALRAKGSGYQIPRGGLYRHISCPNYLGEMMEWLGWAICTWSLAGLSFAVYTIANLGPRALANHRWYQQTFSDYPPERKVLIPFLW